MIRTNYEITNDERQRGEAQAWRNAAEYFIYSPSNCGKTNHSHKLTRELEWRMFRERVRLLEIIAIIRVSISRKFIYVYRRNRLLYVLQQQRHRFTERGASKFYFYL